MIIFSQAVIEDRLQALTRALDSDPNGGGQLKIYPATQPSAGAGVSTAPLAVLTFAKPSLNNVTGAVLTLNNPAQAMVLVSGVAAWARLENGAGQWVADLNVGLAGSGAAVALSNGAATPSLQLYAGGTVSVTLAKLAEA